MHILSMFAATFALASVANALTSSLQQVSAFTSGPTAAKMYVYLPTSKKALAPIVVAIHYCQGTGPAYFSGTQYASYADTYGFIVIYPSSPSSGGCWDVASTASLTHNGGGDSETIVNMVAYAVANYGGDASRVYATGSSSGAMMSNVLAGAYPNVFQAISLYSGVPDGCFYVAGATAGMATPGWNSQCANGQYTQTAQQWGDLTRSYYPGYTGARPKMMVWHGTVDAILLYPNLAEEVKQWSNVLDVSFQANYTNDPQTSYTKMVYGTGAVYSPGVKLVAYSAVGVGHTVPVHEAIDLAWFCISQTCPGTSGSSTVVGTSTKNPISSTSTTLATSVKTTSAPATTTTASSGGTIAKWGQCGGIGWTGSGTCAAGSTCTFSNNWYSQCL